MSFKFAIDRGGTFTDVYAELPGGGSRVLKLLSVDDAYDDAPTEGVRRILEAETGQTLPRGIPIPTERIAWIRMGTTVATNGLLERKGARVALVTTRGFGDVLHIGDQTRSRIFDLRQAKSAVLHERVVEVDHRCVVGADGSIQVERAPDVDLVRAQLEQVRAAGVTSVAICFVHSYVFPHHEEVVAQVARQVGFAQVSVSSQLVPMIRFERRASTAVADAYLSPLIRDYLERFRRGFADLDRSRTRISFMMSDGGLCPVDRFTGFKAVLSGPAGGVVGYSRGLAQSGPLIGFDMGGTSTDVSRFDGSSLSHCFDAHIAGVKIQAPQLDITTVAAGGGSRLFFASGLLSVGPESAGAAPGPVCYRKPGGVLAVTDANLVLGRIVPALFPRIFGPNADEPLDHVGARRAMEQLLAQVNSSKPSAAKPMTVDELYVVAKCSPLL